MSTELPKVLPNGKPVEQEPDSPEAIALNNISADTEEMNFEMKKQTVAVEAMQKTLADMLKLFTDLSALIPK